MSSEEAIQVRQLYVNGQWIEPRDPLDVINPATGRVIARVDTEGLDAFLETKHVSIKVQA
jgi:acyl-CoA reductase-like NAD-dependent aldehyde dehydrogenase